MKTKLLIVFVVLFAAVCRAGDITPGFVFADGSRLYAAQLGKLVSDAIISETFFTSKTPGPTNLQQGDILLAVLSSGGQFHKMAGSSILKNPLLISDQAPYTSVTPYDSVLIFDPTNNLLGRIKVSDFTVGSLTFSNALSDVSPMPWGFDPTNHFRMVGFQSTNGLPVSLALSNLEIIVASDLGTNLLIPYTYAQIFYPQNVLGTNPAYNAWGTNVVFPVTNLYMPPFSNSTPSLLGTDFVPIHSAGQASNTTATLDAIDQYNWTRIPRANFRGTATNFTVSTSYDTNANTINVNIGLPAVAAVSFSTNLAFSSTPAITTNVLYFAVPTPTNNKWLMLFTNYSDAVLTNNMVQFVASAITPHTASMHALPTYTNNGLDVIDVSTIGGTWRDGVYRAFFRTPRTSTNYFVTGTALAFGVANPPPFVGLLYGGSCTVDYFDFVVADSTTLGGAVGVIPARVSIVVFPP